MHKQRASTLNIVRTQVYQCRSTESCVLGGRLLWVLALTMPEVHKGPMPDAGCPGSCL